MTSNITLYSKIEFSKAQNMTLDSIETYLGNIVDHYKISVNSANYFKHQLQATLYIELSQTALNFSSKHYSYARIYNIKDDNTQEKYVYYFIDSMKWASKNVLELNLTMDTVTTIGTQIDFSDKTLIHRQHVNRYYVVPPLGLTLAQFDSISEGINPILYKTSENILKPRKMCYGQKWYIVYRNHNVPSTDYNEINPVETLIMPEHSEPVITSIFSYLVGDPQYTCPFTFDKYYTISSYNANENTIFNFHNDANNTTYKYKIYKGVPKVTDAGGWYNTKAVYYYIVLRVTSTSIYYEYRKAVVNGDNEIINESIVRSETLTASYSTMSVNAGPSFLKCLSSDNISDARNVFYTSNEDISADVQTVEGIDFIDRTDSRLIKIVELPYCPLTPYNTASATGLSFGEAFSFESESIDLVIHAFLTPCDNIDFLSSEIETDAGQFLECAQMKFYATTISKTSLRLVSREPKLHSSEFFQRKFVYDSFSYTFKNEDSNILKISDLGSNYFKFRMNTSLAITSKFNFDLSPSWTLAKAIEDYPLLVNVARNNESPIYTSQYINYLRTGLQYDLKNKERQTANNIGSIILSTAGSVAGAALGVISGNAAVGVAGIISGATALTSSIVSAVNQSVSAQQNLEQKQAQLKAQSVSVQTSDDLPLLKAYTKGNWAKLEVFRPSSKMEDAIFDMLFYTGYKCEYMGKPDLHSRNRFNFIQADIIIDKEAQNAHLQNYPEDIINNYIDRFRAGLTIIHYYNNEWDIEQKYENWETIFNSYLQ